MRKEDFTFVHNLRGAEHITSSELVYLNADLKTKKSAPWPSSLKAAIPAYEKTPPENG